MKITFLGAGVFGSALAKIAEENGHEIRFYDPYKYPDITLSDATHGSDLNIYTAPSSAANDILPNLEKTAPLICASKGFLSLKPFKNFENFTALGGAGFAKDIKSAANSENSEDSESQESPKVIFTTSSETAEHVFSTENVHLEYTKDTLGIILCGALKNVYAIGAGLYGESDSSAASMPYLESAISEMQQILRANHADPETLRLSCGAADLVLSCTEGSRNFRFGKTLKEKAQAETLQAQAESPQAQAPSKMPQAETIEGLHVINSIKDTPDFIIPESAEIFKDIIKIVKEAHVTK